MKQGRAVVLRADATNLPLEDSSVDLVITSPPYFALRSYRDGDEHYDGQIGSEPTPAEFLEALWSATREMVRVLKPRGSIFVNLGDKYAGTGGGNDQSGLSPKSTLKGNGHVGGGPKLKATPRGTVDKRSMPRNNSKETTGFVPRKSLMGLPWRYAIGAVDQLDLILRAEIVWSKPNGLPESVTDRVRRSHEQWFHFTKGPSYFSAVDEIRVPHAEGTAARYASGYKSNKRTENGQQSTPSIPLDVEDLTPNPLGKLPGSVWTIPTEPLRIPEWARKKLGLPDHFAAFPTEWPRRLILGWSPSAICLECGEGRAPVVEKAQDTQGRTTNGPRSLARRSEMGGTNGAGREVRTVETATILGYSCACPAPTAETQPAVVLDPFGGTGTVALVATTLGRDAISVDLSGDYSKLAKWRIAHSGHGRKALSRTMKERQGAMEGLA